MKAALKFLLILTLLSPKILVNAEVVAQEPTAASDSIVRNLATSPLSSVTEVTDSNSKSSISDGTNSSIPLSEVTESGLALYEGNESYSESYSNLSEGTDQNLGISAEDERIGRRYNPHRAKVWEWVVPMAAIGVGTAFAKVDKLTQARRWVQKGMATNPRYHTSVDNYMQYGPIVESYALQLAGYKGEHNLVDRTVVLAMSYVTFAALNLGLKHTIGEKRPDSEATNSFPSGHSGTVMVGAECLRREYWNRNRWVAISGYAMVVTTNCLRIHNNRHWINDVIAGDALGFLSTTFAYWLYPKLFRNHNNKHQENMLRLNDTYQTTKAPLAGSGWIASPVVNSSNCGIACSLTF